MHSKTLTHDTRQARSAQEAHSTQETSRTRKTRKPQDTRKLEQTAQIESSMLGMSSAGIELGKANRAQPERRIHTDCAMGKREASRILADNAATMGRS